MPMGDDQSVPQDQQLNQPPNQWQSVQPPPLNPPLETPQSIQDRQSQQQPQGDPLDQIKNSLAQQYQAMQAKTAASANGGRIKQLLGNFVQGAGEGFLHAAGLPTPYEQQQRLLTNIQGIESTQATVGLHQTMQNMYGSTPVQMPDGSMVNVLNKDLGKVYDSFARSQATVNAAGIRGGATVQAAQINQGMMMPVTPEQARDLGLPPGTTQMPLKQLGQATRTALAPLGQAQGAQGPAQFNKFDPTGSAQSLGIGNPRVAAQDARWIPVAEIDGDGNPTGAVHLMRAGQAGETGAETPQSAQFKAGAATLKSATSGQIFNTTQAYDTAIVHMQVWRQTAHALGNGDFILANRLGQAINTQFGGDQATNFNIAKQAFAGEVGKAFAGANVAQADRQDLADKISQASSPAQLEGYAATAQKLLESKRGVLAKGTAAGIKGQTTLLNSPTPQAGGRLSPSDWLAQQGRR